MLLQEQLQPCAIEEILLVELALEIIPEAAVQLTVLLEAERIRVTTVQAEVAPTLAIQEAEPILHLGVVALEIVRAPGVRKVEVATIRLLKAQEIAGAVLHSAVAGPQEGHLHQVEAVLLAAAEVLRQVGVHLEAVDLQPEVVLLQGVHQAEAHLVEVAQVVQAEDAKI
jgi:hypothetical protein